MTYDTGTLTKENLQEEEELIANGHLPEWEQDACRLVYYWSYDPDIYPSVYAFLDTKLDEKYNPDGWSDIVTIKDYYECMQPVAVQDLRSGMNATFAIMFIFGVNDMLAEARGDDRYGCIDNMLDKKESGDE